LEENYRPDVRPRPRLPRGRVFTVCRRGKKRVRTDASPSLLPPLSLLPLPPPSPSLPSAVRADAKKIKIKIKINFFYFFLVVVAGLEREIQFSVFGFQSPKSPNSPNSPNSSSSAGFVGGAPRASWAKPREEEGFFGLVPLVTHPSSIPLLGGLTPKLLSLSLHSL
jgi:hypothetical protein